MTPEHWTDKRVEEINDLYFQASSFPHMDVGEHEAGLHQLLNEVLAVDPDAPIAELEQLIAEALQLAIDAPRLVFERWFRDRSSADRTCACGQMLRGKQLHCSAACRKSASRLRKHGVTAGHTSVTPCHTTVTDESSNCDRVPKKPQGRLGLDASADDSTGAQALAAVRTLSLADLSG